MWPEYGLQRDLLSARGESDMSQNRWTLDELHAELACFEQELRAARLKESSIHTYIDRTARLLRWLDGDYVPQGPCETTWRGFVAIGDHRCAVFHGIRLAWRRPRPVAVLVGPTGSTQSIVSERALLVFVALADYPGGP
jgi:hypothetical protein